MTARLLKGEPQHAQGCAPAACLPSLLIQMHANRAHDPAGSSTGHSLEAAELAVRARGLEQDATSCRGASASQTHMRAGPRR
jgi:hypothetical protein